MKRISYLQRAARRLGATPLLVPPRRRWAALPDAARNGREADGAEGSAEQTTHARPNRVAADTPVAAERASQPPPDRSQPSAVPARFDELRTETERPPAESVSKLPPRSELPPKIDAPEKRQLPRDAGATRVEETSTDRKETSTDRHVYAEPRSAEPKSSPAPVLATVAMTDDAMLARPIDQMPVTAHSGERRQTAARHRADSAHVRNHNPAARTQIETADAESQQPSVHIGAIEVHVDAPRTAVRRTAPERLARGFTHSFGLRQG